MWGNGPHMDMDLCAQKIITQYMLKIYFTLAYMTIQRFIDNRRWTLPIISKSERNQNTLGLIHVWVFRWPYLSETIGLTTWYLILLTFIIIENYEVYNERNQFSASRGFCLQCICLLRLDRRPRSLKALCMLLYYCFYTRLVICLRGGLAPLYNEYARISAFKADLLE